MATVRRRLRSGHAVWEDRRAIRVPHAPLRGDVQAEVLVMVAGITGALIADALAAAGRDVAIIDRRGIARGSTLVSTALVQYEIDTPLTKLVRKIGRTDAVRAWRRSRLAVEALAMRLSELTVPSVRRRDTLYLAGGVLDGEALRLEHIARRASGLASRFLNRRALLAAFGIRREAALQSFGNLVIDPRQTTLALIRAAAGNGARIFTPVDIVDVYPRKRGVTLTAAGGQTLKCRHLVFATGYELPYGVPRGHHRINSTWGDRHRASASQPSVAGRMHHLGSQRALSLYPHNRRRPRHLRGRG